MHTRRMLNHLIAALTSGMFGELLLIFHTNTINPTSPQGSKTRSVFAVSEIIPYHTSLLAPGEKGAEEHYDLSDALGVYLSFWELGAS